MFVVRSLRALMVGCIILAPAVTFAITYRIDEVIGSGSVTGYIETDGTLGNMVSGSTHFVDWNIILSANGHAVALFGPLSGNNSVFIQTGQFFSATPSQLTYELVDGSSIGEFQFCHSGTDCDALPPRWVVRTLGSSAVQALQQVGIPGTLDQFESYMAPHSLVFVPEPGLAALLAIGSVACCVATRRRCLAGLGSTA